MTTTKGVMAAVTLIAAAVLSVAGPAIAGAGADTQGTGLVCACGDHDTGDIIIR